jgi:hypothetical protein
MRKLNKNAAAWVRALRSGKFRQTRGKLGKRGAYCCLGVACELAVKAGVVFRTVENGGSDGIIYGYGLTSFPNARNETQVLPDEVRSWLGLTETTGDYLDANGQHEDLTKLNDEKKFNFKQIAAIVESRPEELFAKRRKAA